MKIGILGTGIGGYHAMLYKNMHEVDDIIVYGRDTEKLNKLKTDLGINITSNIDDIMTDKEISLIDVCLPSELHLEYTIMALENGKDVFCETPFCTSLEDALKMKKAQDQYGKKVFVNMFIKFDPPYKYLYDTVNSNSLGKLKSLCMQRKTPPIWGDLGLDRISIHLMIHEFDFLNELLGVPERIVAIGVSSINKPKESNVTANLKYKDAIASVYATSMLPESHPFTIGYEAVFENGVIEFVEDGYSQRTEKHFVLYTGTGKEEILLSDDNCFESSLKHVVDCCINKKNTMLSIEAAIKSLEISAKIRNQII